MNMLCNLNHEPLEYRGDVDECPACNIRDDLTETINDLREQIKQAEAERIHLQAELDGMNARRLRGVGESE